MNKPKMPSTIEEEIEFLNEATYVNRTYPWGYHTRNGHRIMTAIGIRGVEITGDADTAFSQPARCKVKGVWITGYITSEEVWWNHRDNRIEDYVMLKYFRPHTNDEAHENHKILTWHDDLQMKRAVMKDLLRQHLIKQKTKPTK